MGGSAKCSKNRAQHTFRVGEHVVVPETDDTIALRLDPAGAGLVILRMLSTVDFDNELDLGAKEIDDVGSQRMLASEAETFELSSAQVRPKSDLGIGRRQPQFAREGNGLM